MSENKQATEAEISAAKSWYQANKLADARGVTFNSTTPGIIIFDTPKRPVAVFLRDVHQNCDILRQTPDVYPHPLVEALKHHDALERAVCAGHGKAQHTTRGDRIRCVL